MRFSLKYLILILILEASNFVSATNSDSLEILLAKTVDDTNKVKLYYDYSHLLQSQNPDKAISLGEEGVKLAKELDYNLGIAKLSNKLGYLYYVKNKPFESLNNYNRALKIHKSSNRILETIESTLGIGNVYYRMNSYDLALKYFIKAYDLSKKHNLKRRESFLLNNMGLVYSKVGEYQSSLRYYKESIKIKQALNYNLGIAITYGNLGDVHNLMEEPEEALSYYTKSLLLSKEIGDNEGVATSYNNLAEIYLESGNTDSALVYLKNALTIAELNEYNSLITRSLFNIGISNVKVNNISVAAQFFHQAENVAKKNLLKGLLQKCYSQLMKIYANSNNYPLAFQYSVLLNNITDSINNSDKTKEIIQQKLEFEYLQKEAILKHEFKQEQSLAQIKEQKRKIRLLIIIGLLAILLITSFLLTLTFVSRFKKSRKEKFRLKDELNSKNKKLIQKALRLNQTNSTLESIKENLKKIILTSTPTNQKELQSSINELNVHANNENFWEEFELHFSEVHKSFYKNLFHTHPNLTINEKKLCAYLKMNMSTKDIASITLKSQQSLEKARSRLRQKLNLSSSIKLSSYLEKF